MEMRCGTFTIGEDIPEGEYLIIGTGYGKLSKNNTGRADSIITNENYVNRWYIETRKGEQLYFDNGVGYSASDAPRFNAEEGVLFSGMYKIGVDIPPGEYHLYSSENGYFEVSNNSRGTLGSLIVNGTFSGTKHISLKEGCYLKLLRCTLTLG